MIFDGISKTFSTVNSEQYNTIGAFWDEMSTKYGRENLRGLGYNWTDTSIEYVIGLKSGKLLEANCNVELPENGWFEVKGRTENLGQMYEEIYAHGRLKYEIEMFNEDGSCYIKYCRDDNS